MVTCLRIFARVPGYIFPVVAQLLTSGQKDALAKHQDSKGNYHFYVKDPRTRESRSMRGMIGPSLSVDRIRKELEEAEANAENVISSTYLLLR